VPVGLLHVELHERAGELLLLPRRGGLASPQANDHVLPAHRLARVKRDILDDAVALVEDAEHRDPLRHRRHASLAVGRRSGGPRPTRRRVLLLLAFAARGERERCEQGCGDWLHAYSGIQGS
jgi:hypothetical protein